MQTSIVFIHAWVVGERACGNLRDPIKVLQLLQSLPSACVATPAEVLTLMEQQNLMGRGNGSVDAQLLA